MVPNRLSRRSALQIMGFATLGSGAGCLSQSQNRSPANQETENISTTTATTRLPTTSTTATSTPSESPRLNVGESATVNGTAVTISAVETTRFLVVLGPGMHWTVHAKADEQYVLAHVSGVNRNEAREAMLLELDGEMYETVDSHLAGQHDPRAAMAVPADITPQTGLLRWDDTAEWQLPATVLSRLRDPPAFEVRRFDVVAEENGDATATFEIRNVGGHDGTFIAELGSTDISDQSEIRVPIPAGETVTQQKSISLHSDPEKDTIILDWGSGRKERTISA